MHSQVYALLDRARAVLARQAALSRDEAEAYERSDHLDPSKSLSSSTHIPISGRQRRRLGRRRSLARRANGGHYDHVDVLCENEDPLSLSSDELRGRDETRESTAGLPMRPRSHGDRVPAVQGSRKRGLPAPTAAGVAAMDYSAEGKMRVVEVGGGESGSRACTWRGRLEGSQRRGHEKGSALFSGKKFEDLDDYLRGRASVATEGREKRKRRLLGSGNQGGGGKDGSNSTSTVHTVDEDSIVDAEGHEVGLALHD